jgi:hypothetical protein
MDDVLEFFIEEYEYDKMDCYVRSDPYRDCLGTKDEKMTSPGIYITTGS